MKNTIIALIVVFVVGFGLYFLMKDSSPKVPAPKESVTVTTTEDEEKTDGVTTVTPSKEKTVIGTSIEKRDIVAYHFGEGATEILLIGGIHGGYSWNTALVAFEAMDYFKANPNSIPKNIKVTVVPVLNPDGLFKVTGTADRFAPADVSPSQVTQTAGRFNARTVDLNRNFDCDWQPSAKWQSKAVSGGTKAFSEPESQAIRSYVEANKPSAVVVWYSAAGGVYSSSCGGGVSSVTKALTSKYAVASGYPANESFDFYETSGDMANWFAKSSVPAVSVLLTNHTDTEWTKNKAGIEAVLTYFAK